MRYMISLSILVCVAVGTNAQVSSDYQVIRSKPSGDLILQVSLDKTNGSLYSTCAIEYSWFTVTNQSIIVHLPKNEYFCYAQMFDSANKAVPLRWSFRNMGKHYFDLKYPSTEEPWDAIKEVILIRPPHGTQAAAAETVFAGRKSAESRTFSPLEDIFQLRKPGKYNVRLQFQVYERIYKGGQTFLYKLERFEPLEFSVTKE